MQELEIVVVLGIAILLGQMTAAKVRLAPPIVLLVLGIAMTFVPGMDDVGLPAEIVLMVFLPVLLYWDSLGTSLREIRTMKRVILINATLLVVVTAAAVACVGHWLGLPWGSAWIVGAAVAPTDATAVSVLGAGLTRRQTATLKAESLGNDGTALVVFALAVELASGEGEITFGHAAGMFAVSFLGGVAIGLAVGWLFSVWGRRIQAPIYANVLGVLTPFIAYMLAESIEASGVLAVVVCGLYVSQVSPRFLSAGTRQLASPFWGMTTFLLNGALFVLVGAQIPAAVQDVQHSREGPGIGWALGLTVALWLTTFLVRFLFSNLMTVVIRTLDRRPQQRAIRSSWRGRVVSAFAGFRGAVSMAVALSVPAALPDGAPFPDRGVIVLATAGVVVLSLVVQGVLFPIVVRWGAGESDDDAAHHEAKKAWFHAWEEVLEKLPHLADRDQIDDEARAIVQREYEGRIKRMRSHYARESAEAEDDGVESRYQQISTLKLRAIETEREALLRLRDKRIIDDEALRQMFAKLDVEELRITGPVEVE